MEINMDILDLENLHLDTEHVENELFENFADKYLADAVRIVATKNIGPMDGELIHEAMCIVVAMYMHKVETGQINKNKVMH
jgi:hypothetical protein